MKILSHPEIRQRFLDFFQENGHLLIANSSLIPKDDPTLLLTNSGMAPLKPYFTGVSTPPASRLCDIQECIRLTDLSNVGNRNHLTFFEMMGNWSIDDYFKKDAIRFAWQLLTRVFGFNPKRLYATIYSFTPTRPEVTTDTESEKIWESIGLPQGHIVPLQGDDNFWGPAGTSGPCGPCTEIFYDRGNSYGCGRQNCKPGCSCDRFLEIWNGGVFMEYNLDEDNRLTRLPLKSVDAGAGLERFAVILQQVDSVYETDLLAPIFNRVLSMASNEVLRSARVVTDHVRCTSFMLADGILPSNVGRGYVARRLIRRAIVHAQMIGINIPKLFAELPILICAQFSEYYPELHEQKDLVIASLEQEYQSFDKNLRRALQELEKIIQNSGVVSGKDAFRLFDTYGLPVEIMQEILSQKNMTFDEQVFQEALEEQRARSRQDAINKKKSKR